MSYGQDHHPVNALLRSERPVNNLVSQVPIQSVTFTPDGLATVLAETYGLPGPIQCQLYQQGLHALYQIQTPTGRYMLRVVNGAIRTQADLQAEVDLLTHLHTQGLPVQRPVPRQDGAFLTTLTTPGPPFFLLLFHYLEGHAIFVGHAGAALTEHQVENLGQALARLHHATDQLSLTYAKPDLSLERITTQAAHTIASYQETSQRQTLVHAIATHLHTQISALDLPLGPPSYGICHGDFFPGNAIWHPDGRCTLIDFDLCAQGYRVFDLATLLYTLAFRDPNQTRAQSQSTLFVATYNALRPLSPAEHAALPLFVAATHLHLMALRTTAITLWGLASAAALPWERQFDFLTRWATQHCHFPHHTLLNT